MNTEPRKPAIELLRAPAASGKTHAALAEVRRAGSALLVVPSRPQADAANRALQAAPHVQVLQFGDLAAVILRRANALPPLVPSTARLSLVRRLLARMRAAGQLPTYAPVAEKAGFVADVAEFLNDLGNAAVAPAAFAAAAQTPHDHELAALYGQYVQFQAENNLADRPRALALARLALEHDPALLRDIQLVLVDGFDQFAPVQLRVLAAVARAVPRVVLTLTGTDTDRPAQRRFGRTATDLAAYFDLHPVQLPAAPHGPAAPLRALEQTLFELDTPEHALDGAGVVAVVEAADREREVRAALRHVQRLMRGGAAAEQIAVLFRSGAPYTALLREVAAEYGVPLLLEQGTPLHQAPPVAALMLLLRLPSSDYPRRATVEALRSPYVLASEPAEPGVGVWPSEQRAAELDAVGRWAAIGGGLAAWLTALERLAEQQPPAEDDLAGSPLWGEQATALAQELTQLAGRLSPPAAGTVAEYVDWVREQRAALRWGGADDPFAERDQAAMKSFDQVLHSLAHAAALLRTPATDWPGFWASLDHAVAAARFHPPHAGGVAATTVLAARGRCWAHVCLLGLSEGDFPQPLPEPAVYGRIERQEWATRSVPLPTPNPADERTIFYEAVTRARQTLLLARTRLDETGTPLPRSPYLASVLRLMRVEVRSVAAGSVPRWDEAASPHEHALAAAAAPHHAAAALLAEHYPAWPHVLHARAVEAWREGTGPFGPYEGAIDDAPTRALVAAQFGAAHQWSTTQFNDYITCPFRFATAHVLQLAPQEEPDAALDATQRGQLYHAILARAGQHWRRSAIDPAVALPAALDQLSQAAQDVFSSAPERFGFVPGPFWAWEQAEIDQQLRAGVARLAETGGDWADFALVAVEQSFGGRSALRPLQLDTPSGPVLVRGRIDRIDQRSDGALAVIDYKSSATPRPAKETIQGHDLQLPIYAMAAEQVLPFGPGQHVERAAFFHIRSGKRGGVLQEAQLAAALQAAHAQVGAVVAHVRVADFRVQPRAGCPAYCAFVTICRVQAAKQTPEPAADAA